MRWGVIGYGYMGQKFLNVCKELNNINVTAIASKSQNPIIAPEFSWYSDYSELISDRPCDAIYIATTPDQHFEIIDLGLTLNVPMFCEKPIFFSKLEILNFKSLTSRTYLAENITFMFDPIIRRLLAHISSGKLGKLSSINILLGRELNPFAKQRLLNSKISRGALHDYGMYAIYFLNVIFDDLSILNFELSHSGENDYAGVINLLGDNNVICLIKYSIDLQLGSRITMKGDNGVITLENFLGDNSVLRTIQFSSGLISEFKSIDSRHTNFARAIMEVSSEVRQTKLESCYLPLDLSIRTAKIVFDILN